MKFNLSGMTFIEEGAKSLRPSGEVEFKPEPDNKYDKSAVGVWFDGFRIGYVPRGEAQAVVSGLKTGKVADYGYLDGEEWNNEGRGVLQSVTVEVPDAKPTTSGKKAGVKYMRVTSFLSYFDAYGGGDGLIKWAFDHGNSFEEYKEALNETAEAGTAMHSAIEAYLGGNEDAEGLPAGWWTFIAKYEIRVCYMEERFYDNVLNVSGQPDLVCYVRERKKGGNWHLMVFDWKSSKKPSVKHKLQLSIYAKNVEWKGEKPVGAVVVAFGAENKQGFSASKVTREQIETNYKAMRHLRACVDLCAPEYFKKYWEGE
jgi:hypothetical protein